MPKTVDAPLTTHMPEFAPEVAQQRAEDTNKINEQTSQMIRAMGWEENSDAPDLFKSDFIPIVRGGLDSEEDYRRYEGWKERVLRSKEPVGKDAQAGKPIYAWITVKNVAHRWFGDIAGKVPKPGEAIPFVEKPSVAIVFYNRLHPEKHHMLSSRIPVERAAAYLLDGNGQIPAAATIEARTIEKYFAPA